MKKQPTMKKLNLGCGKDVREGWVNLDVVRNKGVDVVWDLEAFPYPFKDNEFDYVLMDMSLEHLSYPEKTLREIWRITKKDAVVEINVPHFSCWQTWGDITHRRGFNHGSLNSFSSRHRDGNSLQLIQKEVFNIESKITFGKIKKAIGFERVFNLNNYARGFYEKNLSSIFPAENVKFMLTTIK